MRQCACTHSEFILLCRIVIEWTSDFFVPVYGWMLAVVWAVARCYLGNWRGGLLWDFPIIFACRFEKNHFGNIQMKRRLFCPSTIRRTLTLFLLIFALKYTRFFSLAPSFFSASTWTPAFEVSAMELLWTSAHTFQDGQVGLVSVRVYSKGWSGVVI